MKGELRSFPALREAVNGGLLNAADQRLKDGGMLHQEEYVYWRIIV